MRHPHHIAANFASIFCSGSLVLMLGCASTIDVDLWDADVILQAHTWAFLHHDPPIEFSGHDPPPEFTYRITSPLRDAENLDAKIAGYIEGALAARGFERVATDADFYVDYQLTLQPRAERVEVPLGQRYVPSFSFSQSYIIEGLDISLRTYEALRLEIDLRERRGRILWRGELLRKLGAPEDLALAGDVDKLIDRLPAAHVR